MKNERIDILMVNRGLAESRTKAQALIMSGVVLADEKRVDKPSQTFSPEAVIRIKGETAASRYVGRGGLKLEHALDHFGIDPSGMNCLDIGASTGGFTDCLLQHGASRVVAIDSGTNQLDWKLRNDPRVDVHEQTNARDLKPDDPPSPFDLIVMDVSFISVTKIIPTLIALLKDEGKLVILIKPQFEVGKGEVGKGGIVREPEKHTRVIDDVNSFANGLGLVCLGVIDSPILGQKGNKEFLAAYEKQNS
ncbi:MAG: TlyA family RNA methyltransferase [Acidobacteria bacterium]|nr:TlyA family RNA methyltransferase [Acidobacteriota bacterium]